MRWIKIILYAILFLYAILCLVLFFTQEKILFYPDKLPLNFTPWKGQEVWLESKDNIRLNAALIKQPNPKGAILYLHGNKGSLKRCLAQTQQFDNMGYDILVLDYRSFGKSEGTLKNDSQMYDDAQLAYDYLSKRYENIIIVGYSMGSGMASFLAANNPTKALLLIAPFVSIVDMKNRYLPIVPNFLLKYKFRSDLNLKKVSCPVIFVHGTNDEVVPFDSSIKLNKLYPSIEVVSLPGVGHRRVIFHNAVGKALRKLVSL